MYKYTGTVAACECCHLNGSAIFPVQFCSQLTIYHIKFRMPQGILFYWEKSMRKRLDFRCRSERDGNREMNNTKTKKENNNNVRNIYIGRSDNRKYTIARIDSY